ncbi:hypothetical protein ISX50_00760 [Vibrio cyclitrophicus]|nr:hypothetical protein [Vibrio cyclitrophicus]UPR34614.1 hypothetical protein ISX50_00760 [Vibrio cyclitrophicus]
MDSVISSVKENLNLRLKNPFIGSFIFAWVALNIKGISIFFLVDTQIKIEMLRNKEWLLLDDFLFPMTISIAYLVLLPFMNLLYDKFNDGWLTPLRLEESKKRTTAQIQAESSYIRDYEYGNLAALVACRTTLSEQIEELKEAVQEYAENSTLANEENVGRIIAVTNELSNLESTLRTSTKGQA